MVCRIVALLIVMLHLVLNRIYLVATLALSVWLFALMVMFGLYVPAFNTGFVVNWYVPGFRLIMYSSFSASFTASFSVFVSSL